MDPASRQPNPDFVLNQPRYAGASILLARRNFGCGSSREHAPWAIAQYGFRALIAPSYADIFFNNCFKNGLLPIVQPEEVVSQLFAEVAATPGYRLTIDLERQRIVKPDGSEIAFDVQPFRKYCLLGGSKIEIFKNFLEKESPLNKGILTELESNLKTNFIYNSNAIEGNTLTLKETDIILQYGVTVKGKSLKEHEEVKGQEYAINFLKEIIKRNEPLSLRLIREFHSLVLNGREIGRASCRERV